MDNVNTFGLSGVSTRHLQSTTAFVRAKEFVDRDAECRAELRRIGVATLKVSQDQLRMCKFQIAISGTSACVGAFWQAGAFGTVAYFFKRNADELQRNGLQMIGEAYNRSPEVVARRIEHARAALQNR